MPSERIVTPRFLTREIAELAVKQVLLLTESQNFRVLVSPFSCHIVILVPSMKDDRTSNYPDWPNYDIRPWAIYEQSIGTEEGWSHRYDEIARCKALQLWQGRNDSGTDTMPHLLFSGDTPYWGGVKRDGIVVACSGLKPWLDKMIAGMICDMCIALAYNSWMVSGDKEQRRDFLGESVSEMT